MFLGLGLRSRIAAAVAASLLLFSWVFFIGVPGGGEPAPTVEIDSGILYSTDAGLTWRPSDLANKYVTALDRDTAVPGRGFASVGTPGGIEVYETDDGGAEWSLAGRLPDEAGVDAHQLLSVRMAGDLRLLVSTPRGLWLSEDEGDTWAHVRGLPEDLPRWLAALEDGGRVRVFVVLAGLREQALPQPGLYVSADLRTWEKEAGGTFRLSESYNRRTVLAAEQSDSAPDALMFALADRSEVPVPSQTHLVAGAFDGTAPIIALEGASLHVPHQDGQSWRRVLDNDWIASVGAAPDFPASGVAVAGGWRYGAGIYRSGDGGATWKQVLGAPGPDGPWVRSVHEFAFLSDDDVVATHGETPEWLTRCPGELPGSDCLRGTPTP